MAAVISFFCGLISLGGEILWVRLFGFANESTPRAFGFVLFCYLIGIALGAEIGKKACVANNAENMIHKIIWVFVLSSLTWIAFPFAYGLVVHTPLHFPVGVVVMIASAAIVAYIFPMVHHLGAVPGGNQGKKFSKVYVCNVVGAGLGPLLVGWYLLDKFTLHQSFLILAIVALLFALWLMLWHKPQAVWAPLMLSIAVFYAWQQSDIWLLQNISVKRAHLKYVDENKHGMTTIFSDPVQGDMVFGGNVYDGRTNLNGDINSNGLHRVLVAGLLKPKPKRVLMVGLSIGTWLALVREFEGIETLDAVEINPGYAKLITHYPDQAAALSDPRVNVVFDDARRWLRLHPEKKYDLIVMNSTWHWRSNTTLLLSQNFFDQLKTHMMPGAVMAFNSTYSQDAFYTAYHVFGNAYRLNNFVYASDHSLKEMFFREENIQWLRGFKVNGNPIFSRNSDVPEKILDMPFVAYRDVSSSFERESELITDENMLPEFKYGKKLF